MAALGTLSAGLGHDMTNLLMPLRVRLDSLRAQELPPPAIGDVQAIGQCTEYLSRLVSGLRTFAADPDAESHDESVELAPWWTDVKPFLSIVPPTSVQIEAQIPSDIPPVRIGKAALTQAVFNLVQNATNAIAGRAEPRIVISALRDEEGFIRLSVTDNGVGMTDEVKNRCIEPFFTTKTRTFSTGLGLSLVHGIIQRAGGKIHIDSAVGRGTTFTLILNAASRKSSPKPLPRTTACVSVNDTRVKSIISALLNSLSCDVTDPSTIDGSPLSDSHRWIINHADGEDWLSRATSFLQERPGRRVLIINAPTNTQHHVPGLTILPAGAPVADLRAALVDVASPTGHHQRVTPRP
jgi:anti-sigma regulatory factor (Ser/Thr protein kinase)